MILCIVGGLFALMSAVNASWAVDCLDPPSGMVSWWPGDGNANDIEDGNDGTLENGATFADGKVDRAFSFDGLDDYVEVIDPGSGSNLDLGKNFTLDAWIFNEGPGSKTGDIYRNYRIILLKRSLLANVWVYGMRLNPGNATGDPFQGVITDPSGSAVFVTTTERVPRNAWSHVAMTYDGISLKLYINGVEKASVSTSITLETNNEPVRIGNWNHLTLANIQHFKGLIDEVEILDRALSAEEILAIYEAGSAGKCKAISVYVDIKPESCPNPLNVKSKGVLPVAILGTEDFDVTTIDPTSVHLKGVPSLRSGLEDVEMPFDGKCLECATVGPDEILDLTLKFDTEEIVKELGDPADGAKLCLELTGKLFDGTPILGEDGVRIINKGNKGKGGGNWAVVGSLTPTVFSLFQNSPNPFARETSISYTLPASGHTTLKIYDTSGRLVTTLVDAEMSAGIYTVTWNRKNAASGIYFYRLTSGGKSITRAMTVIR